MNGRSGAKPRVGEQAGDGRLARSGTSTTHRAGDRVERRARAARTRRRRLAGDERPDLGRGAARRARAGSRRRRVERGDRRRSGRAGRRGRRRGPRRTRRGRARRARRRRRAAADREPSPATALRRASAVSASTARKPMRSYTGRAGGRRVEERARARRRAARRVARSTRRVARPRRRYGPCTSTMLDPAERRRVRERERRSRRARPSVPRPRRRCRARIMSAPVRGRLVPAGLRGERERGTSRSSVARAASIGAASASVGAIPHLEAGRLREASACRARASRPPTSIIVVERHLRTARAARRRGSRR